MNVPLLAAGARQLDRVERDTRLDGVVAVLRRAVRAVVPPGRLADALHGTWLGHPLHPALSDTYRLHDGEVRRGPATMPQPVLTVRVTGDRIEARRP
jgi:hypothetical protein